MPRSPDFDVIVIGARCAGAAVALNLARAGLDVLVAERAEAGSDTLSSHTMTRGAVSQLSRWGLLPGILATGTPPIARSVFRFGAEETAVDVRPLADGPGMLAPRRAKLDAMLGRAAAEAGADLRYRTALRDLMRDDSGRVIGARLAGPGGRDHEVTAALVVGADGLRSTVARRVGATERPMAQNGLGHIYGYFALEGQKDNLGAFVPGLSIGLTPTDDDLTTAIISAPPDRVRNAVREHGAEGALFDLADLIDPEIGARLREARMPERARVFAGQPGFRRTSSGPGWALIGDAGQFRDPVTSHGMTDAFRDAEHMAQHVLESDFDASGFEHERNAVSDTIFALTAEMARFDQPLDELRSQFVRLSGAMREEQRWMDARFGALALAA